jgi:hypothetical protein
MSVISFPPDPIVGETYEFSGNVYEWDGVKWRLVPQPNDIETASEAIKLQTAREINGTLFDGTADIITEFWGTARNFTIGSTTISVDGSGDYEWSLGDLGSETITIEKTLTLQNIWQDTGISGEDLETGAYTIQLYANDIDTGGFNNNEFYTGTMSWFSGPTSESLETPNDEIVLHRAGGGSDAGIFLRTLRSNNLKLQIFSNIENTNPSEYSFRFKKLI